MNPHWRFKELLILIYYTNLEYKLIKSTFFIQQSIRYFSLTFFVYETIIISLKEIILYDFSAFRSTLKVS